MQLNRRSFIRSVALAGSALVLNPLKVMSRKAGIAGNMFCVHPFIQDNPDAVFIMKTNVDVKTNAEAMKEAGLRFADSVLGLTEDPELGISLNHKFVFKPNLTCRSRGHEKYTIERSMGIVTDSNFMEGIIESMKELGIPSSQMYMREVNCAGDLEDGGYISMADRTGIDLAGIGTPYFDLPPEQIQWVDVPDGVYFKRIPYLWPVNSPDSWLMNVAKLKTHGMGLTLSAKNIQGTIAMRYQEHCRTYGKHLDINAGDYHPDAFNNILANYNRRMADGVPRWDRPGNTGGIWQETWGSRCLDNNSATSVGLQVIEGIYGRDGNFMDGPGVEGIATDYMCNYIIFGMNAFYVDIIGHWLGGHEPGNFGLFHMAKERGMITHFNPSGIPLYDWDAETGASLADLKDFDRTPLKTYYLQKDYDGGTEPYWHLVDEAYDYTAVSVPSMQATDLPFSLDENFPNPVKWKTTIPFSIQHAGHVYIEVINPQGMVVDILEDRQLAAGSHMVNWQCTNKPAGLYLYRMRFAKGSQVGKILVYH
jgi:hypothetical protein